MKISHTDIPAIFMQFLDAAIAPKANGMQKFCAYAAAFIVQSRMPQIVERYAPVMRMAGIMSDDGMIDLDLAHNLAAFAIDKAGKVNVCGYMMDSADVEQIHQIAKGYAQ